MVTFFKMKYAVYGLVDDQFKEKILMLQSELKRITQDKVTIPSEDPHITILFGPTLPDGEDEILTNNVSDLLPKFMEVFGGIHPEYSVCKVAAFDRENGYIIHVKLNSPLSTEMQSHLRLHIKEVGDWYNDQYSKLKQRADDEPGSLSGMTEDYQSYAMPPKEWCHITLGTISREMGCRLGWILSKLNERLLEIPEIEIKRKIKTIALVSAITDTIVPLW
jgi:hypothetical protein